MRLIDPLSLDIPEELHGPRVTVRTYRLEDTPQFWQAIQESREHLAPWLPWVHFYHTIDDCQPFILRARARFLLREDLIMAIFDRATGRYLGGTGLSRINWDRRTFEIGYWVRRSAEGQGYIRETVQVLTRFAFEHLQANRVEIRMDPRNTRSRNVPERLGFVLEGTLRRGGMGTLDGTTPTDAHIFALIPEDYDALEWSKT